MASAPEQRRVSSCRYSPPALIFAISQADDNQVGRFSFYTKEAILKVNYITCFFKKETQVNLSNLLTYSFKTARRLIPISSTPVYVRKASGFKYHDVHVGLVWPRRLQRPLQ